MTRPRSIRRRPILTSASDAPADVASAIIFLVIDMVRNYLIASSGNLLLYLCPRLSELFGPEGFDEYFVSHAASRHFGRCRLRRLALSCRMRADHDPRPPTRTARTRRRGQPRHANRIRTCPAQPRRYRDHRWRQPRP